MPSIGVLEHTQKPTDRPFRRMKRSGGQSLVFHGRADWVIKNVLLIMRARQIAQVHATSMTTSSNSAPNSRRSIPDSGPSQSIRSGILRWEPPKSKRQLKAHPWQNLNPIADQGSVNWG